MKSIIKDEELIQYVNDRLSCEERKQLERKAIINNETDLLFNCVVTNYLCNQDYANELLGEDDFMIVHTDGNRSESPFVQILAADKKNPKS